MFHETEVWGWQQLNSCGVLAETVGTQRGQLLKCCSLSLKQTVRALLHHIKLLNQTTKLCGSQFSQPTQWRALKSDKSQAGCLTTEQSQLGLP